MQVVDCGLNKAPNFPDSRVQHFKQRSMTAFCADPVIGFGLVCGEVAQRIDIVYPDTYTSLLNDAIQNSWYDLLGNCYEYCQCLDIMPATPARRVEGGVSLTQANDPGFVSKSNVPDHSNLREPSVTSSNQEGDDATYYCSNHLHGSPSHEDCGRVLDDIKREVSNSVRETWKPESNESSSNHRWFWGAGRTPAPYQASNLPTFDLPKTYSKGSHTCDAAR